MLTPDVLTAAPELELLHRLAGDVPEGQCIVELGVFRGGSLKVLAESAWGGVPVYGVDSFGDPGTPDYYVEGSPWIKWWEKFAGRKHDWVEDYKAAMDTAPFAKIIVADTATTGVLWAGEPVGLLYIDADHSYEGVRDDWNAWRPWLAPGATVVFDDYRYVVRKQDHYPGVSRFVDELGLTIMRVGKAAMVRP